MKKLFLLFILLGCFQSEKEQMNSGLDYLPIDVYDFSVNNQFLSSIKTDYRVTDFDTVFYFQVKIFELNGDIKKRLELCENSEEELDEIEKSIGSSECKSVLLEQIFYELGDPLREIEFTEANPSYFVDFTNTYGSVEGKVNWVIDSSQTKLKIEYLKNELMIDIYDQKKLIMN